MLKQLKGFRKRLRKLLEMAPRKTEAVSKLQRYKILFEMVSRIKARHIMEIGTWNGNHAVTMIETAKKHWLPEEIEYHGFDLFENMDEETFKTEISKKPPSITEVKGKLEKTGALFMAVGKPEISTKIKTGQLVLLAILIYPFTVRWGIMGAAMTVTAYMLAFNFFAIYKVLSILNADYEYEEAAKVLLLPLLATSMMIIGIYALKKYVFDEIGVIYFLLLVAAGIVIYLLMASVFDKVFNYGSWRIVREQFATFLHKA